MDRDGMDQRLTTIAGPVYSLPGHTHRPRCNRFPAPCPLVTWTGRYPKTINDKRRDPVYDEPEFHEPFGPIYERPTNPDCPNCDCCTAVLCEQGRSNVWGCLLAGDPDPDLRKRLADCPCSNGPDSFNGELMPLVDACNRGEITEDVYRERVGALLAKYGIADERPLSGPPTTPQEG